MISVVFFWNGKVQQNFFIHRGAYQVCLRTWCDLDDTLWPLKPTLIRAEKETYNWLTKNAKPLTDNYSIRDIAEFRYQLFRNKPQFHNQISKVRIATIKELALLSEGEFYVADVVRLLASGWVLCLESLLEISSVTVSPPALVLRIERLVKFSEHLI